MRGDELTELLSKHKKTGILIDANLFLLLVIGRHDKNLIPSFKRTSQFTIEDFDLLSGLVALMGRVLTTPNILTEVNSLANQLGESLKGGCYAACAAFVESLAEERYLDSRSIVKSALFDRLGLTDIGILRLSEQNRLVLTDDLRPTGYLQHENRDVINFNHIRMLNWNL